MDWRHGKDAPARSPRPSTPAPSSVPDSPSIPTENNTNTSHTTQRDDNYFITVGAFDIFTRVEEVTVALSPENTSPAIDLMAQGWVSKTPERPSVVVSITTLDLLHRLRRRKPSFSIEAFTKVVCDYYMVSLALSCLY